MSIRNRIDEAIKEKTTRPEKLETALGFLRDAKQGKVRDDPRGLERFIPRGENYYVKPDERISPELVAYCQAWVDSLDRPQATPKVGGKALHAGGGQDPEETPSAPVKQDYWNQGFADFKGVLCQLSIKPNLFIKKDSYNQAGAIYDGHFQNPDHPTSGPRIDWRGTWTAFKYLHELLVKNDRIQQSSYSRFFADHFMYKGKTILDVDAITDRCRGTCSPENVKKLEKILL